MASLLLDPELLKGLSEDQKKEALQAAAAAKRAEERAEQRALERAVKKREEERRLERERELQQSANSNKTKSKGSSNVVFIPKRKRQEKEKEEPKRSKPTNGTASTSSKPTPDTTTTFRRNNNSSTNHHHHHPQQQQQQQPSSSEWSHRANEAIKKSYLGKSAEDLEREKAEKRKKARANKKITFRFKWDEEDDTFQEDDPLYTTSQRRGTAAKPKKDKLASLVSTSVDTVRQKSLGSMTTRDWRILRENYEISVKGGRAPPPMRSFSENPLPTLPPLHPSILDALHNVMKFREPTPIQRQSIPIGLQRRDLIGIAETGSGKTVAFGVPICNYLINLPATVLNRVAEEGPLAIVMAPTRELALQINEEFSKMLARQRHIKNCCIIGGQQLQHQAAELRKGVHIVVGTPGRINECLEMAYLVLNQCACAVLDEGDRMIDMGFAPQIESVLDAMGAALKSENEEEAYEQEKEDVLTQGVPKYRVTALFSATMPMEVEQMAKKYLRHPAVVSIGDKDSGKNARIVQRVMFLSSPAQKEKALRDLLSRTMYNRDDKTIVFVNEKKHADGVARMVERMGRTCVVLHGGKSQDQREENLERFRKGGVVLVATDVAGRGIDIPNVSHIINFDLPTRSIENYSHRIGRTGRAGKEGLATSFITDEDEGIMAPLKAYLESTGNPVPVRLAKHPAASSGVQSNLIY
ncbi:dependent RNA helicase [Seminavis robusta]|uniref:RNA helicase n=1 Tax=Seminavis robusta TaxID=568900 RepID=A0A9N8EIX3_9STRA|nr:dependent RNA helicase [Seminavis robusta]|eukprot:Sro1274_g258400.1 dependent RNA helicase (696) ;mRNA; f:15693-18195